MSPKTLVELLSNRPGRARTILEKTFHYSVPQDKEKLLFDFYAVAYLNQFKPGQAVGDKYDSKGSRVNTTARRNLDPNTQDSFQDTKEKLLSYLKTHLLRAVLFAISAEFRHVLDHNQPREIKEFFDEIERGFITKYVRSYRAFLQAEQAFLTRRERAADKKTSQRFEGDDDDYADSFSAVKSTGIDPANFVSLARAGFKGLKWASNYGGKPWADICAGWLRLYDAKSEDELFIAIDHVYDLQHNTDTVFNKLKSYYKHGYGWVNTALDFKRDIKKPHELLDRVSPTIRALSLRVLKAEGFETWEQFAPKAKGVSNSAAPKAKGVSNSATGQGLGFTHHATDAQWDGGTWTTGVWHGGIWLTGVWENGRWNKGIWRGGIWKDGVWVEGDWRDGDWWNGKWFGGTWHDGTWENGDWFSGEWKDGEWKAGNWSVGVWERGVWENGVWTDGVWKDGTWENGYWYDGEWNDGHWTYGYWKKGHWRGGHWFGGTWQDGYWDCGNWHGGNWHGGTWASGTWYDGTWQGGTWKKGYIWVPKLDKSVYSEVSPADFDFDAAVANNS